MCGRQTSAWSQVYTKRTKCITSYKEVCGRRPLPSTPESTLIGTGSAVLVYRSCWCLSPFPLSPSIPRRVSIRSSPAIGFRSCFFLTTNVSAPIRSTLLLLMASFQACSRCCGPRGGAFDARSNFCLGQGLHFGPHSLMTVNVTTRLRRTRWTLHYHNYCYYI